MIVVGGFDDALLRRYWDEVTLAARNDNGHGVHNEEQGVPVRICRGQRRPWAQIWPELRALG